MQCPKCQINVNEKDNFCPYCGNRLNNDKNANTLCLIVIMLVIFHLFGGTIIQNVFDLETTSRIISFISNLGILGLLGSMVLVIYIRVKYPYNLFSKVLMWLYIIAIIILVILFILAMIVCNQAASYCGPITEGCIDTCDALE